jgi:hypothetical protein
MLRVGMGLLLHHISMIGNFCQSYFLGTACDFSHSLASGTNTCWLPAWPASPSQLLCFAELADRPGIPATFFQIEISNGQGAYSRHGAAWSIGDEVFRIAWIFAKIAKGFLIRW